MLLLSKRCPTSERTSGARSGYLSNPRRNISRPNLEQDARGWTEQVRKMKYVLVTRQRETFVTLHDAYRWLLQQENTSNRSSSGQASGFSKERIQGGKGARNTALRVHSGDLSPPPRVKLLRQPNSWR